MVSEPVMLMGLHSTQACHGAMVIIYADVRPSDGDKKLSPRQPFPFTDIPSGDMVQQN